MPDPIAPSGATPHVIDLEPVVITATPSQPAPTPPLSVGEIALECSEKVNAVAVALLTMTPSSPVVGALAGYRVGFELGACIAKTVNHQNEVAANRRSIAQCLAHGGFPVEVSGTTVKCGVVKR
jgi:hypothetical protein